MRFAQRGGCDTGEPDSLCTPFRVAREVGIDGHLQVGQIERAKGLVQRREELWATAKVPAYGFDQVDGAFGAIEHKDSIRDLWGH